MQRGHPSGRRLAKHRLPLMVDKRTLRKPAESTAPCISTMSPISAGQTSAHARHFRPLRAALGNVRRSPQDQLRSPANAHRQRSAAGWWRDDVVRSAVPRSRRSLRRREPNTRNRPGSPTKKRPHRNAFAHAVGRSASPKGQQSGLSAGGPVRITIPDRDAGYDLQRGAGHANPTPPIRRLLGPAHYPEWQYD